MMSEDRPLTDHEIERIASALNGNGKRINVNQYGSNGSDTTVRRLFDGLLLIGITSLVAVVWNLSGTVAALNVQVGYVQAEIQQLRARSP